MTGHPQGAAGPSQRGVEIGVGIAMAIFAGVIIVGSLMVGAGWGSDGPKAGFFPFYVGLMILAAAIFNIAQAAMSGDGDALFAEWSQLRQVMSVAIPTAVYVAFVPWLGIYVSSIVLIAFFMRWFGRYAWPLVVAVSIGVPVAFFLVFELWFLVPLPKGPVENWLGY